MVTDGLLDIGKPKNNNLYWRTKSMLAKEMKICSLVAQRNFIVEEMTKAYKLRRDGNAVFTYKGVIYPENLEYFKNEGFDIRCLNSKEIVVKYGTPYYMFYPKLEVKLNESDMLFSSELAKQFYNTEFELKGFVDG